MALAAHEGGARVFWSDDTGINMRDALAQEPPTRVVEGRGIRELSATEVHGTAALAWARRDLASGRTRHRLRWQGEERLLLDALQPYDVSVAEGPLGPVALIARREGPVNVLRLIRWDGSEAVVRQSELSLVRYQAKFDEAGVAHVVWLEGFTERNAVGISPAGEWSAFVTGVSPTGETSGALELGPARYLGIESQTALALLGGEPNVLWPGPNGEVLIARPGQEPLVLGRGSPVGLSDGTAYWSSDTSIRSRPVSAAGEAINVSWSPVTILRGELAQSADEEGRDRYLAWYGPTRGGANRVFSANDLQPFQPILRDRIAARMGWSPWSFWEALMGQLLGALFAGVLISMALTPLIWLLAVIVTRNSWASRPTSSGITVGALLLLALLSLATSRSRLPEPIHGALFGTLPELLVTLLLAALATWWVRRRADSEQLIGVLSSAWLFIFLGTSTLAFLTFQAWLEYWPGVT